MLEDAKLIDNDYDEGAPSRSWGTGMDVDGVHYATSLFWQPLQNFSNYMTEVEEASTSVLEGADLFCIKGGKAPQFGICVSHEGYKKGENAAAVAVATALSNVSSFVAVFRTQKGWWYTCIRNDIILSDGDMLFLNEEEAKNQFMSMLAVPDWGKKIAPKEWDIDDTEDVDLSEILQRGAKAKLQKIKGLRGSKLIMVIVISAVLGLWLASSLIDKLFFTPAPRPVVAPIRPKAMQPVEIKEVPKPWENIKDPSQIMRNCFDGISKLTGIMPPGWNIGNITCVNTTATTSWNRDFGRLTWAEEALKNSNLEFSSYSFDPSGNSLSATLAIPEADNVTSPPEYTLENLRNIINDQFQSLGLPIALGVETTQASAPQPQAPMGKGPQAPMPQQAQTFSALTFTFDSPHNPLVWSDLLTKYSGLKIKMITYNPGSNAWHYEGAIYVL